jgi:hypothetical protein
MHTPESLSPFLARGDHVSPGLHPSPAPAVGRSRASLRSPLEIGLPVVAHGLHAPPLANSQPFLSTGIVLLFLLIFFFILLGLLFSFNGNYYI